MSNNYLLELEKAIHRSNNTRIKELFELVENINYLSESATNSFYLIDDKDLVMSFLQKGGRITAQYFEMFIYNIIKNGQLDALKFICENSKFDINTHIMFNNSAIGVARNTNANEIFSYLYYNPSVLKSEADTKHLDFFNHPVIDYCPINSKFSSFNHLDLLNNSVINYCPINSKFSIISSLLSNTYGNNLSKESITTAFSNLFNYSSINADILTVSALSLFNSSIAIQFADNIQESHFVSKKGGYATKYRIVIEGQEILDESVIIHELTHLLAMTIFDPSANPYKNEEQKEKFLKATKDTLSKIINYLNHEYGYNLPFQENKSTYEIAEMISYNIIAKSGLVFAYKDFAEFLQNNNLLDSFVGLEKLSLLTLALGSNKVEFAKALMLNGASTDGQGVVHYISRTNNISMLDWLTNNKISFDINEHNCEGERALDIANTFEMRQALIRKGAVYYPLNYQEFCEPININVCKVIGKSINLKISPDLIAISELFKYSSHKSYKEADEYAELLAYFVQLNSQEVSENKIIANLTEPLHGYWKEVVVPASLEYQQSYDMTNPYLSDMFQCDFSLV